MNLYAYTWNDPYNWTDPSGLAVTGDYAIMAGLAVTATVVYGILPYANDLGAFLAGLSINSILQDNSDDGDGEEAQEESGSDRIKEIIDEADDGRKTKGPTTIKEKTGGNDAANDDFDRIVGGGETTEINTKYGPGRTAEVDGHRVTVRPGSSDGRPTVEIRYNGGKRGVEVRYNW